MDIRKIVTNSKARKSRNNRPIKAFVDLYDSTDLALKEITALSVSEATYETLLKSHIINTVTAVEVYYRDILDSIFRLCKPESFTNKLKQLHDRSYKIDELIEMYIHRIHPLELISNNLNFQNTQNIEKVFTILLGKSFFKELKTTKWRLSKSPENEYEISHADIEALQELFDERHKLIHNPHKHFSLKKELILEKIDTALGIIIASDIVISNFINENIDPELTKNGSIDK